MNPERSPSCPPDRPGAWGSAILDGDGWKAVADSLGLSRRQMQIVRAVFDDAVEFAMAEDMSISRHTVHTHLERIYRKFGVHDRVGLVLFVMGEFLRLTSDGQGELPPICDRCSRGECPFHPGGRENIDDTGVP